jgi:hypothetical protein
MLIGSKEAMIDPFLLQLPIWQLLSIPSKKPKKIPFFHSCQDANRTLQRRRTKSLSSTAVKMPLLIGSLPRSQRRSLSSKAVKMLIGSFKEEEQDPFLPQLSRFNCL